MASRVSYAGMPFTGGLCVCVCVCVYDLMCEGGSDDLPADRETL